MTSTAKHDRSPLGAELTLAELETDPHAALARLREHEPVSWVPVLDGWLVTRRDLCIEVMRDAALFTVDDPRFSTAQVVGPSMLSLDGDEHRRHRDPFARAFLGPDARARFAGRRRARGAVARRGADAGRSSRDPAGPGRTAGRQRRRRCARAAGRDAGGDAGLVRRDRRGGRPRLDRRRRRATGSHGRGRTRPARRRVDRSRRRACSRRRRPRSADPRSRRTPR